MRSHGGKYGDNSWLLIKEQDEFARPGADASIVDEEPASVLSGRSMQEIGADPDRVWHSNKSVKENVQSGAVRKEKPRLQLAKVEGARKAAMPAFVEPELATLVKEPPAGESWLHEMKYDGYRMLCRIDKGEAEFFSRNGKDWTVQFATIARAAARLPVESAWIDGEVVVMGADGRSSFQALQNVLSNEDSDKLQYYVFDVPYLDGHDLRGASLLDRKRIVHALLASAAGSLYESGYFEGQGTEVFVHACKLGLEGIVSKLADAPYRAGRTREWVKTKCAQRQELVIGGFTNPEGARNGFGALLVGVYEPDGSLRYSGKVGTGFNEETLAALRKRLDRLVQKEPPFSNPPRGAEARRAHWVKPELVGEVSFTEWTADGTLRHPAFQGLREDKKATEVVRERPAEDAASAETTAEAPAAKTKRKPAAKASKKRSTVPAADPAPDTIAGIKLSNPGKLLYPESEISKRELALYYASIGEHLLPHLRERPLSLVRCPDGWPKQCFYQKHADKSVAAVIDRVEIQQSDGPGTYMMANSIGAIVAIVQMGVLEIHPWGSRADKLGFADRIIFDFDPDDSVSWETLVESVNLLKMLLEEIGLRGFLKTTGGKGLHVVLPIKPTLPWDTVKAFSKTVAELMTATFPDRFTSKVTKSSRSAKIFIDYLRNGEGATAVAAYSTPRACQRAGRYTDRLG